LNRPRIASLILLALLTCGLAWGGTVDSIPGLVAWYAADSLQLNDGAPVRNWRDLSPHGHDLVDDRNGAPALLRSDQLNGLPAVRMQKANSHSVTDPFVLTQHTIFIVYATDQPQRALFRGRGEPTVGLLLRDEKSRDIFLNGPAGAVRYGTRGATGASFGITVLGRESNALRAFVAGEEVSSGDEFAEPIRVGKFFALRKTQYVTPDADSLRLAELVIYDRYLNDAERERVAGYLADKYALEWLGVEVAEATTRSGTVRLAQLSTSGPFDVNVGGEAIRWDRASELDAPFMHQASGESSRLYCTSHDTRVRLHVSLPLDAEEDGANIRLLFRVNGSTFLPGEGRSGVIAGDDGRRFGSVQAEVVTRLDAGDYVEVVTIPLGAPGVVRVPAGAALFSATVE